MASDYRVGFRPFPWLPAGRDPFEVHIEMAVEAETLGFDGVFTVDRMLATAGTTAGMVDPPAGDAVIRHGSPAPHSDA